MRGFYSIGSHFPKGYTWGLRHPMTFKPGLYRLFVLVFGLQAKAAQETMRYQS